MTTSILVTKLFIPPTRLEFVHRPGLIERLNAGLHRKLTLISAPAGFGKTALVSSWINDLQRGAASQDKIVNQIAWVSLDERDNDLTRFLAYLVAALQTITPNIGEGVLGMLQSPQQPPTDSILTELLNEIATIPGNFVLVLDDYHLLDAKPVDQALIFLLEHLPPQMHLVIATREDPSLPLARLRVRGQLTELRANDLCFTNSEATGFLNQVMGLNLTAEEIAALETRTEGWIAGLQMAALAMQGQPSVQGRADTTSFIQAFTGSHRFVLDYLVEEILQQQSERVRSFLLKTAVLHQLSGPLCNAVTGQKDGKEMLEALDRGNLFVVPLDDKRQWYRYHHLFADVLQAHLIEKQSQQLPILHQRASKWYEQNGSPPDAVRHALAANDLDRVANLTELTWEAMDNSFQFATWLNWVKALPDKLIQSRPVLCTQYAMALSDAGELEASESRLRDAERWLDVAEETAVMKKSAPSGMVVNDEQQFQSLPARIAIIRSGNAQILGDIPTTIKHAELALKLTPEEEHLLRAQATMQLGFTRWVSGDLAAAQKTMTDWIDSMHQIGNIIFAIASSFALADIMVEQGSLREAVRTYKQSLQLASKHEEHTQQIIAHHHLGLALLYHEMDNQEATAQNLSRCRELGKQSELIDWPYRWCMAQAMLKEAGGEFEDALDLLDEAKHVYIRNPIPYTRPVEALKARVHIKQGRLSTAHDWANKQGLAIDDDLSYLREFEHITLARVKIAEYLLNGSNASICDALDLLARLLKAAEEGKRRGSVIEILMLQAVTHQAMGDLSLAFAPLERALTFAEPEGYMRMFVNEGSAMAQLLLEAAKRSIMPDYVNKLLAAFSTGEKRADTKSDHTAPPSPQPLIEPLSQRELDVLQLLKTELSGPEIARELTVALSTVRTHTKSIYSKLNVNSRRTAVKRATELDLI
ncbi:MAG: helix-turn-helix transcriptional regulator [Chloroflexi bacterium]|nr:MAG: helix-turn-helix transcriptional regulator [Chloroflexota bacterium]